MGEIIVDTYLCNGCGTCVAIYPDIFQINPTSEKAELIELDPEINDSLIKT